MKAVVQDRYGSLDELVVREVDAPVPGDDDVLVRVRAASLHPDVWHVVVGRPFILRAMGGAFFRPKNPIPGTDLAGVVERVGKNVRRFKAGDEVFGETIGDMQWVNGGSFAEFAIAPQNNLALKPGNVSFEQAAAVPSSGYILLFNLRGPDAVLPGQQVLVNGAGGGVGSLAVQLAKSRGAHVTAVDSTAKLDLLRELGADEVVDFTCQDFAERPDFAQRFDLLVDIPGDRPFKQVRRVLAANGRYLPIGHDHYGASGRRVFGLIPHFFKLMFLARFSKQLGGPKHPPPSKQEAMLELSDLLESGRITPVIDRTFGLSEVPEALRYLSGGEPQGRIVIVPE